MRLKSSDYPAPGGVRGSRRRRTGARAARQPERASKLAAVWTAPTIVAERPRAFRRRGRRLASLLLGVEIHRRQHFEEALQRRRIAVFVERARGPEELLLEALRQLRTLNRLPRPGLDCRNRATVRTVFAAPTCCSTMGSARRRSTHVAEGRDD